MEGSTNTELGSRDRPLRVAIVGSGPAGFYTADWLFRAKDLAIEIDLFERFPTPFGLVRFGVAPDHQKIKRVAAAFERTLGLAGFRFLGNVNVGKDISAEELRKHYDQVVYAYGSATDRRMGIPGEDLAGSHAATAFVGWYNAHPDFVAERFDLSTERAVVVGMGNVAMDVTRVLIRSPDELADTDIAPEALAALRKSRVREIVLLGRRGPAQAAFDQGEIKDIAELEGVDVLVDRDQALAAAADTSGLDAGARKNVQYLAELAERGPTGAARRVVLRFLASPAELSGEDGRVRSIKIEHTELTRRDDGSVSARGTGRHELLETGLVMRSIGYHGTALSGVPFDERAGVIPNVLGRVTDGKGGAVIPGVYAVGWIKRGPTGLIGTNKSDAKETADKMLEDVKSLGREPSPERSAAAVDALLAARGVHVVGASDWRILDAFELESGKKLGKVREKLCSVEAMLAALRPIEQK
jgi:ferredoxin/flavodoxin---NADP+ reductase